MKITTAFLHVVAVACTDPVSTKFLLAVDSRRCGIVSLGVIILLLPLALLDELVGSVLLIVSKSLSEKVGTNEG